MKIRLSDAVLLAAFEDEAVLLHSDTERYFGLNSTAFYMLEVLNAAPSLEAAREQLRAEFDVAPNILDHDLERLIAQLRAHDLIEEADSE